MRMMISGATTTVEALLADADVSPYLGAQVTPNTSNSLARICGWGLPWCCDNACYDVRRFDPGRYVALAYKASVAPVRPVFVTVPDVVGDHRKTRRLFDEWAPKLEAFDVPLAFVAQDGLSDVSDDIPWERITAVFIGGSDEFKDEMTLYVAEECRLRSKWCHLGRVNGRARLRLALLNDVDSVDGSSLSRFPRTWLARFARDIRELEQEACWLDRRISDLESDIRAWDALLAARPSPKGRHD